MPVYKDKKRGTWYYAYSEKQANGSHKQIKKRGFAKKKEAQQAEMEAKLTKEKTSVLTFEQAARYYMEWYEKRRKESSVKVIRNIIINHLIPVFGEKKADAIMPKDILAYQDTIIESYAPDFLDKIHTTFSAVFNHGIKFHGIEKNPAKIAGNFPIQKTKRINYWTLDEFKQFIDVVEEEMYRVFWMVMYYSGARKGELLALRWYDIDFETNTISITKTTNHKGGTTTTKTPSSSRELLMPHFVMQELEKLKGLLDKERQYKKDYVVFGAFYDIISTTTLDRRYSKYIKESGVKKIVMHEFRHSHASYLINNGVGPAVVAERLGHKSVATTLDTYAHLYPNKQIEAVAQMEHDFE